MPGQGQRRWREIQAHIAGCDKQVARAIAAVRNEPRGESFPAPAKPAKAGKNSPLADIAAAAFRFYGTRLDAVEGVGAATLCTSMSELGAREQMLAAFPTPERFCSWLGPCPDNRVSGGKAPNRVAKALRPAVFGLQRSEPQLAACYRRMKARPGKAEGTVAAAHNLARIIHALVSKQCPYDGNEAFKLSPQSQARGINNLKKQAAAMGYQLIEAPSCRKKPPM